MIVTMFRFQALESKASPHARKEDKPHQVTLHDAPPPPFTNTQTHKYTNTQIHKEDKPHQVVLHGALPHSLQIHKYTNTQTHKEDKPHQVALRAAPSPPFHCSLVNFLFAPNYLCGLLV